MSKTILVLALLPLACVGPAEEVESGSAAVREPAASPTGSVAGATVPAPRTSAPSRGRAQASSGATREPERFFGWSSLAISPETGRHRRERLADALAGAGGGVFLAPSHAGRSHGGTFRQSSDFLYLTGLELPDAVLVIDASSRASSIYAPKRDARFEADGRPNDFPGRALADDPSIAEVAGIPILPIEDLDRAITRWSVDERKLWINGGPGRFGERVREVATSWNRELTSTDALVLHLEKRYPRFVRRNAHAAVARLRMVKSESEIVALRRAADVTMASIREAAGAIRAGVTERELEGVLESAYKRGGAQRVAFDSIIKSGPNSLYPWRILAAHYDRRNRAVQNGELVIFDVGCELDRYVSDIGRTFPVSGRFTPRQREVLEMEVAVADAIIEAIRPGVTFADLRRAADAAIPTDAKPYMQARLFFGHHIGLDVGDPSLEELPLEAGMVFTVEPWYYNHDEQLAVFTEDIVVVTTDGCEVLTTALPRDAAGLERMVGR